MLDQDVGGAHLLLGRGRRRTAAVGLVVVGLVAVAGARGRGGGVLRAAALVGGRRGGAIAAAGPLARGVADAVGGGAVRPYLGGPGCAPAAAGSQESFGLVGSFGLQGNGQLGLAACGIYAAAVAVAMGDRPGLD